MPRRLVYSPVPPLHTQSVDTMAFLHPTSSECLLSSLDLFSVKPTQLSIEKTNYTEYRPIASISANQVMDFVIPSSEEYIDLSQTYFYLKARVMKSAGTKLTTAESAHVTPMNYWLHSLFSQIDITINDKLVTGTNDGYGFKSYLQALLSYSKEAKDTQLGSSIWGDATYRKGRIADSEPVEMLGRLHHDLVNQPRLILNNTELKFRLVPTKPEFNLYLNAAGIQAGLTPIVEFMDACLYVHKVTPAPSILLAHARTLANSSAKYPYKKTELKTHTLVSGMGSAVIDNIFNGSVPSRVTIGLTQHNAFNGDYALDPFYFHHFAMTSLSLSVDGVIISGKPLTFDFTDKHYVRAYMALFSGLGIPFHNAGIDINYEAFGSKGKTLFCFDLTADECSHDSDHVSLSKTGSVRLELRFANNLTKSVTVVILGEREALMEISDRRDVLSTE